MSPAAASMTYSYFCSDNSYFMNIEELPKYPQLHLEISELIVPYVNYDTGSSAIIEYDQSKKLVFELTINLIQLDFDLFRRKKERSSPDLPKSPRASKFTNLLTPPPVIKPFQSFANSVRSWWRSC